MVLPPTIRQLLRSSISSNLPKSTTTTVSGWIKSIRKQKNISFAVITDGSTTKGLQAVLVKGDKDDEDSLKKLTNGAAVRLTGRLVSSPGKEQACELLVDQSDVGEVVVLGECDPETYPIQKKTLTSEYLRDHTHLRTRTQEISRMVRLRSLLTREISNWFEKSDFTYVHTPIITGNDAEGAGEAFRLAPVQTQHPSATSSSTSPPPPPIPSEFFSRPAFLTVSHQLHLEALATSISRVYTLSPCFRAEPSLTNKHLAEFWMLEAEWASFLPSSTGNDNGILDICNFTETFLRDLLNNVITIQPEIVESLWTRNTCDIKKKRLSIENALNKKENWTRMTYTEAIKELEKFSSSSSSVPKFEHAPKWGRTLQSEHERWLAESLIDGPVFITNYPTSLKPFYMRSNDNDDNDYKTVACFDLLVPHAGELIGGSIREERPLVLEEKMRKAGLLHHRQDDLERGGDVNEYQWYLDLRKFGGAPHAGFGMGFERLVGWIGGVDNIRECVPMPRWAGRMLL